MRNIPGLIPLLDRAAARAEQGPQYRFHGRRSPKARTRTPILGATPSSAVKDGVAKLRLYEPIDSWGGYWGVSALEFLEVLDELDDSVEEIRLHINSPGGEVWEALAILNGLRDFDAKVVAQVDGIAASCASFIACAADETVMAPNTQLMIHDAWGMCIGNAGDMHSTGDLLDKVSDNIASIYADKSGENTEHWRAIMLDEGWYSAQEAVDAGLADKVSGEEKDEDGDPADAFDLKGLGLKYAGRAEAPAPDARADDSKAPAPDAVDRQARFQALRQSRHDKRAS
ncbi:MAG TPA: head maturation protease, ClpP-related [Nocardioidaceae bacterium]|nr:head maturation protease, ClpP-related [Nocardioidaceae bacterium]